MPDIKTGKLSDLTPDPNNANRGTERGADMVRRSLEKLGAGRSVLVDKNGVLIAGNKSAQAAVDIGLQDAIIIPTDGTKLVVVQRTDLDLATDAKAKELAIADNRASEVGLEWDTGVLEDLAQDIELADWFTEDEMAGWDFIKPPTSRFMPDDDDEDIPSIMDGGFPLAIVLAPDEMKEWNILKDTIGTTSDKTLLLKLMRGEL